MRACRPYKEIGACETVNCGRGAALSQFNLRVAKVFRLPARDEHRGDRRSVQPVQRDQPGFPVGAASASAFFTGTRPITRRTPCS